MRRVGWAVGGGVWKSFKHEATFHRIVLRDLSYDSPYLRGLSRHADVPEVGVASDSRYVHKCLMETGATMALVQVTSPPLRGSTGIEQPFSSTPVVQCRRRVIIVRRSVTGVPVRLVSASSYDRHRWLNFPSHCYQIAFDGVAHSPAWMITTTQGA